MSFKWVSWKYGSTTVGLRGTPWAMTSEVNWGEQCSGARAWGWTPPREHHQHPSVQGVLGWGKAGAWNCSLSGTIRYRGLCVMPAGLIVLCLLPCSWIPSSSYLKNTWAAHNFTLSHSSEAVGTTWLFKALSCLPCLAELGYIQSSFVHSKLMSSFKEILFPAQSAARDPPAECGTMALFKIGQRLACVLREVLAMFGIEDCVMGGLNQHLSA